MNYKNISVLRKHKVMASVNPAPHTIAKRMWLSSGRVPLHDNSMIMGYKNVLVLGVFEEMIREEIGLGDER